MNKELKPIGIDVHTICPGGMDTNFQKNAGVKKNKNEVLLSPKYVVDKTIKGIKK